MTQTAPHERWLKLGLFATLVALVGHAIFYRFLCDDAFISFRYARNWAAGDGLVFNPGFERVEGYTNFLWVAWLAAFDVLGAKPEHVAPVLSLLLTVVLWGLVARAAWRYIPEGPWRFAILLPTAWLAVTRSVAVWATRLFRQRTRKRPAISSYAAVPSFAFRRIISATVSPTLYRAASSRRRSLIRCFVNGALPSTRVVACFTATGRKPS
jgi:hypothetical protein